MQRPMCRKHIKHSKFSIIFLSILGEIEGKGTKNHNATSNKKHKH